jgi:osmotically-inducible protein OsmY
MFPYPDDAFRHRPKPPTPAVDADTRIARLLSQRLFREYGEASRDVAVIVQNRVVVLSGSVPSSAAASHVGALAWATPDVYDVCNCLTWA